MTSELNNNSNIFSIPIDQHGQFDLKSYNYQQAELLLAELKKINDSSPRMEGVIWRVENRMAKLAERFIRKMLAGHQDVDTKTISAKAHGTFAYYRKPIRNKSNSCLTGHFVYGEFVKLHSHKEGQPGELLEVKN